MIDTSCCRSRSMRDCATEAVAALGAADLPPSIFTATVVWQ